MSTSPHNVYPSSSEDLIPKVKASAIPSDEGQRVTRITAQIGVSNYHFDTWYFRGTTHTEVSFVSSGEELCKGNEGECMAWFLRTTSHAPDEMVAIYRILHDL